MYGKTLKVMQYTLEFGSNDRYVNVFSCFKYKENNNLYLVYSDVSTKYPIIYYGLAHIREKNLLSMQSKNELDIEIIKEFIYKTINHEALEKFEIINLESVEGLEIIASNKLEVKPEILLSLVDLTIPKQEEIKEVEVVNKQSKERKNSKKKLLLIMFIIIIGIIGYVGLTQFLNKDKIEKQIICTKEYKDKEINANVDETTTYNFNNKNSLKSSDSTMIYKFNKDNYQKFILEGTYYKYLPEDLEKSSYEQDDINYIFKIKVLEEIDSNYTKPTDYEEVFSYYTKQGYTCKEKITG